MMCTSRSLQRGEHFNDQAILAHPPHTLGSAHVGRSHRSTGQDPSVAIRQSARHCPTAQAEYPTVPSLGETHKHQHRHRLGSHHLSDGAHRRSASFRERCKLVRNTPRNDESEYSYLNVEQARAMPSEGSQRMRAHR
jgi:hypothetical protein